jgi:HEPN domain-containing protein
MERFSLKPITLEWIQKAEGDFATARRENESGESPNYDAVAFHAQQCAEKYLKARLIEAERSFPKTHDLAVILDLVLEVEPGWESMRPELNALTDLGVEVRYPGTFADEEDAAHALETARKVRDMVRSSLGLTE